MITKENIERALKNHEFTIYYQPIIDLQNGTIGSTEALIRWKHPNHGTLEPHEFLPLAEETGLIVAIGEWILEQAAKQILIWHDQGFTTLSLKVAINLSQRQLKDGKSIEMINRMMKKTGLQPKFLELEITEAALLDKSLENIIQELSNKGIHLSLDDFGTGVYSLNQLKTHHIHTLKIDRSLIQKVTTDPETTKIVAAMLAMAKELNIQTLGEGVETKEQLDFLQERGCSLVQGFYFCKPLNAEKFTRLLEKHIQFFEQEELTKKTLAPPYSKE